MYYIYTALVTFHLLCNIGQYSLGKLTKTSNINIPDLLEILQGLALLGSSIGPNMLVCVFIHCLVIIMSVVSHCLVIMLSVFIHFLLIMLSVVSHCLVIMLSVFIYFLVIMLSVVSHCLVIIWSVFIIHLVKLFSIAKQSPKNLRDLS